MGIVGGGISGLAAAWHLVEADPSLQVVVLDSSDRPGGKLRGGLVAGVPTDLGAESVLARRPEGVELAGAVGLADRIVHPAVGTASIWSRGALHPMPAGTLMGVPGTPAAALGVLDADEIARAESERERPHPPVGSDLSVGEFVESRMGPAVVDRLVEPLLGGVYAGHARRLSLQAAVPALWAAALSGESISAVAERAASAAPAARGPVFAGISGGVFELARTLSSVLTSRGVRILSGTTVRAVERTGQGWRLVSGPVPAPEQTLVDAVILAVPGAPAARLLGDVAGQAGRLLGEIPYASMAIVTLALPRHGLPPLPGSGFLVPPVEGRRHQGGHLQLQQVGVGPGRRRPTCSCCGPRSAGRARRRRCSAPTPSWWSPRPPTCPPRWARRCRLPSTATSSAGAGRCRSTPSATSSGWPASASWSGRSPGLAVCGAAYDGVGIPACIGSGRAAAAATLTHLRSRRRPGENEGHEPPSRQPGPDPRDQRHASATRCGRCSGCPAPCRRGPRPR